MSRRGKKKRSVCVERKSTDDLRKRSVCVRRRKKRSAYDLRKRSVCVRRPNSCVVSMRGTRKRSVCIWRRTSEGTERLSSRFAWKRLWVVWLMWVRRMLGRSNARAQCGHTSAALRAAGARSAARVRQSASISASVLPTAATARVDVKTRNAGSSGTVAGSNAGDDGGGDGEREQIGDSGLIVAALRRRGVLPDYDAALSGQERAADLALRALLEDKLYFYHVRDSHPHFCPVPGRSDG